MVECSPATRAARVRFPADACFRLQLPVIGSCQISPGLCCEKCIIGFFLCNSLGAHVNIKPVSGFAKKRMMDLSAFDTKQHVVSIKV